MTIALVIAILFPAVGSGAEHPLLSAGADSEAARAEVARLRAKGPPGLAEVVALRDRRMQELAAAEATELARLQAEVERLNQAIDAIGGARYCSVSRLYWYTDFDQACAAAAKENKPILSLWMLGRLDEEFSCANSRFFRTTLYANEEISRLLRDKFVLHWKSVRPVPKVTIDFGDGRKLERTLTGNSIHYVVAADGRPLEGLPGLHGPAAFQAWLKRSLDLAQQYTKTKNADRDQLLWGYHHTRRATIAEAWQADLARLGRESANAAEPREQRRAAPTALAASSLAAPKRRIEDPLLLNLAAPATPALPTQMDAIDDALWEQIAALHAEEAHLDDASRVLIASENPTAGARPTARAAGRIARTKSGVEDPLNRMLLTLQSNIALDTVRNEYVLHYQLHGWFLDKDKSRDLDALNESVYAELFLTPSSDPWLGLIPPDNYSALVNNGVRIEEAVENLK